MIPTHTDLARAARRLKAAPSFTLLSLLTLGVGLGAVLALGTVVYGVLLSPLPFHEPDRLVTLWHAAPNIGVEEVPQSHGTYTLYRRDGRVFEEVGLYDGTSLTMTGSGEPLQLRGTQVTSSVFTVLGVSPSLGRGFTAEEDLPGAPKTVILSHDLWQERFGGDPAIVGRTIRLESEPWEVVGVMPEGFAFPTERARLYVPHPIAPESLAQINFSYEAVARLVPGATLDDATAEVNRLLPGLPDAFPGELTHAMHEQVGMTGFARSLTEELVGDVEQALWVLLATALLVLGIAAANVANLCLARAEGRHREVAVATALGAGRKELARGFLAEALLLAAGAGTLGLAFAFAVTRALPAMAPEGLPRVGEIGLHPPVLAAAGVLILATALLLALVPVLRFRRLELTTSLKEGGRGADAGRATRWSRNALVVGQVAASLVLLAGSVLMLRSFERLTDVEPGFSRDGVLTFVVSLPDADYPEPAQVHGFYRALFERLEALPGVESAGAIRFLPLTGSQSNNPILIEGQPVPVDELPPIRRVNYATPGYFEAMGVPLLDGRTFEPHEMVEPGGGVVVSRGFARHFWGDGEAVGKRIAPGAPDGQAPVWYTVVGVVADVHDDALTVEPVQTLYFPALPLPAPEGSDATWTLRTMSVALATAGKPEALVPQVREAVWSLDPNLPLIEVQSTAELVGRATARMAFTSTLLALAAAAALLLGTVGLYAVVSYLVSRRTREIGVRMALGADRGEVQAMVVRQGMRLSLLGVCVGLVAALAAARTLETLLYGVAATDLATYAGASAVLLAVTALASWLPARRASGVDPAVSLQRE